MHFFPSNCVLNLAKKKCALHVFRFHILTSSISCQLRQETIQTPSNLSSRVFYFVSIITCLLITVVWRKIIVASFTIITSDSSQNMRVQNAVWVRAYDAEWCIYGGRYYSVFIAKFASLSLIGRLIQVGMVH